VLTRRSRRARFRRRKS